MSRSAEIDVEEFRLPHGGEHQIWIRNKRPRGVTRFAPEQIVILMHGSTYPSTAFDLAVGGAPSWMDYLAGRGFDTYALDLPGYGHSTRPASMDAPPGDNPPFMRTSDAAAALGTVIDFVCQRRGVQHLNLIGWSWGTAITATYTATQPAKVSRLVLYAPLWLRTTTAAIESGGSLGAYRVVTREQAEARRRAGLTPEQSHAIMPPAWYQAWADATFVTDPKGGGQWLRAPNGTVQDIREYWSSGRPAYDAAAITCPVMVVVGDLDRDTPPSEAQALFAALTGARERRLVVIANATHSLLFETHRLSLFGSVQQFLEEGGTGPSN